MKKILALLLALVMVFSFAACGADKPAQGGNDAAAGGESAMEALPDDATPAQKVIADFTDKVNSGEYDSLEDLGNALVEGEYLGFAGAGMPVEPGYLNGFTDEVKGFSDGYMFSPMIGSIPFVGYVFTLEEGTDAEEFMKSLEELSDLRWNICTEADEKQYTAVGDKVCFVMSPVNFEE